jgi:uracil-DNA glycosylase family 4
MPYIQLNKPTRKVPPSGPRTARIAIVGEAPGTHESIQLRPFVGPAGGVLDQCLHAAGLIRSECYITNVVNVQPPGNDISPYFSSTRGSFTELGQEQVARLVEELDVVEANVIIACGQTALAALTGISKILKYRGYFFESKGLTKVRKVLPTIHPAAALRGMYIYRYIISADLKKAREHSLTPGLERPARQLVYEYSSIEEVLQWFEYLEKSERLSVDIEVLNFELACIGFSDNPKIACAIPVAGRWTERDEMILWRAMQKLLKKPMPKVGQNLIFDVHFLLSRCGIEVAGPFEDTMVAHSILYPELRKGLDFLGSLYCGQQEYWKSMVRFENIKEES